MKKWERGMDIRDNKEEKGMVYNYIWQGREFIREVFR